MLTLSTFLPGGEVPVWAVVQVVAVPHKDLLPGRDAVYRGDGRADPEPRVVEHHKLAVRHEAVVSLQWCVSNKQQNQSFIKFSISAIATKHTKKYIDRFVL